MKYREAQTINDFNFISGLFIKDNTQFMHTKRTSPGELMQTNTERDHYILGDNIGWFNIRYKGDVAWFGMIIAKEHQGQGYGTEAMKIIEEIAFSKAKTLKLQVYKNNIAGIRLYSKSGFEEDCQLIQMSKTNEKSTKKQTGQTII